LNRGGSCAVAGKLDRLPNSTIIPSVYAFMAASLLYVSIARDLNLRSQSRNLKDLRPA
jgi:YbbR domain-containing protein